MKINTWLAYFFIATVITGCGFHLRGTGLEELVPTYVDGGTPRSGIRLGIERILRGSGGQIATTREQAKIIVRLTQETYQRWPLSISRQLLVQEYVLIYTVGFQITNSAGQAVAPAQSLKFTRDYSFSDTAKILGKGNEETLLHEEMVDDAARQILAQIVVVMKHLDASAANTDSP